MAYTDMIKVDTLAALRMVSSSGLHDKYQANVLGHSSVGDGGEGVFYLDAADDTSPDDDGAVLVATDGARWKRTWSGPVHVDWFGSADSDAIAKANALSDGVVFGPGPYTITQTLLLAGRGQPNIDEQAPGSTWYFNSTKFVVGGSLGGGTTEDPVVEIGFNTTTVGLLVIDGQKSAGGHANVTGIRFARHNGNNLDPCYNNTLDAVLVYDCNRGIHFASDGESGVYFNHINSARVRECTTGVQLQTSAGVLSKVNANSISNLSVSGCSFGVDLNGATGNQFGQLTVEGCSSMNLTVKDVRSLYISGGFIENKDDAEQITAISNAGGGGNVQLTLSERKRNNGDPVRISGTGTALDGNLYTVQNASGSTYELDTNISATGTGSAYLHPGRNVEIKSDVTGVYMGATITQIEGIAGYTYDGSRSIQLRAQNRAYLLGRSSFERVEVGTGGGLSVLPSADHDQSVLDRLRASGGMYCYRHSPGLPYFLFTSPSVASGDPTGYQWRNDNNNVLATLTGAGLELGGSLELDGSIRGGGGDFSLTSGAGVPAGAPAGATRGLYVRTDGTNGTTLYYWDGSSWVPV